MEITEKRWLNFERGVCLALAGLVVLASVQYLQGMPVPVKMTLADRPARVKDFTAEEVNRLDLQGRPVAAVPDTKTDPFSHYALAMHRTLLVTVAPPPPPPPPPSKPDNPNRAVVLARKPQLKIETPEEEPDEVEDKKPFPLNVVCIIRPKEGNPTRKIHVRPISGGEYMELAKGDVYQAEEGESWEVVEITPTTVTFEHEDGRLKKINKDPLEAWRPLLRDEQEEELPDDSFLLEDMLKQLQPQNGRKKGAAIPPEVLKQLEPVLKGKDGKPLNEKQIRDMIQKLKKNQKPGLLDRLENLL